MLNMPIMFFIALVIIFCISTFSFVWTLKRDYKKIQILNMMFILP